MGLVDLLDQRRLERRAQLVLAHAEVGSQLRREVGAARLGARRRVRAGARRRRGRGHGGGVRGRVPRDDRRAGHHQRDQHRAHRDRDLRSEFHRLLPPTSSIDG